MSRSEDQDVTQEQAATTARPYRSSFEHWSVIGAMLLLLLIAGSHIVLWIYLSRDKEPTKERLFWQLCQPGYTTNQREQAFSELLWLGNNEWRSARLEGLDLTGVKLAGADIQNAHMEGCILADADLSDCRLRRTHLDGANLTAADLSGANLFECDLLKSDLRRAVLIETDLRGADLGQSTADGASLIAADMTGANLELASLVGADLTRSRLVEANLRLADLTAANLARTDLTAANLNGTNLQNANWWRADGLSPDQLASLREQYPPSSDAGQAMQQDFQQWLETQEPD